MRALLRRGWDLIPGFDECSHIVLGALRVELELAKTSVVVFDVHERPLDLYPDFFWVQQNPTRESELDKVRIG